MVYVRRQSSVLTAVCLLSILLWISACGKRLNVVTYEKKRGTSRSTTYKTPPKKKEYFDFDEKKPAAASSSKSATGSVTKLVQTAHSYLGTPYRYGGTTRSGMDCSGLLYTSFESIGIKIPRTSDQQAAFGKEVKLDEVLPGDMVFFGERKGSRKVTHAGLITAVRSKGEILFIHSSTSRGVVEDNLLSSYYQDIFLKAVRPL